MKPGNLRVVRKVPNPAAKRKMRMLNVVIRAPNRPERFFVGKCGPA